MLLNVFGFVGDHPNERVELNDGHAQVDDVHRISKETLQCRHKLCVTGNEREMQQRPTSDSNWGLVVHDQHLNH